jgi:transcriptional antiterminator RfaH
MALTDATDWRVAQSKPHKEEYLWRYLLTQGYEVFYPHLTAKPVNPRSRPRQPYFPRYLFVRGDDERVNPLAFRWMPGATGLVVIGGDVAQVPDSIVAGIQRHLEAVNAAGSELFARLKQGDRVIIQEGPFAGYEAIFDVRLSGQERVRVLLKLLQGRCVRMNVRVSQIRPA